MDDFDVNGVLVVQGVAVEAEAGACDRMVGQTGEIETGEGPDFSQVNATASDIQVCRVRIGDSVVGGASGEF